MQVRVVVSIKTGLPQLPVPIEILIPSEKFCPVIVTVLPPASPPLPGRICSIEGGSVIVELAFELRALLRCALGHPVRRRVLIAAAARLGAAFCFSQKNEERIPTTFTTVIVRYLRNEVNPTLTI